MKHIYYNLQISFVFFTGSILYFGWVTLFLKRREVLNYKRFSAVSQEKNKVMEFINGMQEIKLHNAEKQKWWGWEKGKIIQMGNRKLSSK